MLVVDAQDRVSVGQQREGGGVR